MLIFQVPWWVYVVGIAWALSLFFFVCLCFRAKTLDQYQREWDVKEALRRMGDRR